MKNNKYYIYICALYGLKLLPAAPRWHGLILEGRGIRGLSKSGLRWLSGIGLNNMKNEIEYVQVIYHLYHFISWVVLMCICIYICVCVCAHRFPDDPQFGLLFAFSGNRRSGLNMRALHVPQKKTPERQVSYRIDRNRNVLTLYWKYYHLMLSFFPERHWLLLAVWCAWWLVQ